MILMFHGCHFVVGIYGNERKPCCDRNFCSMSQKLAKQRKELNGIDMN